VIIDIYASGSSGNCCRVSDGSTALLFDAGISVDKIQKACGFNLSSVSGCFITHSHLDHSKGMTGLAKLGVNVYTSQGTIDAFEVNGRRYKPVESRKTIAVGTFNILPFDVIHDAPEPLGFLAESTVTGEKLLYITDTAYVKYIFRGITHIVTECNHGEYELRQSVRNGVIDAELAKRIVKTHMSLERLTAFFNANDLSHLKQVYLIHLSDNNSNAEKFKQTIQRVTGAEVYVY
jgi:phosphoribosyl 1,2-cyclic phosphodiesterase